MSSAADLQTSFTRAVEAEYAKRVIDYRDAGLSFDAAHERALQDAKQLGRETLEELHRRGLFPWPGAGLEKEGGVNVD